MRVNVTGEDASSDDGGFADEDAEGGVVREGSEEWKAARLDCGWEATLRRFEEMVSAAWGSISGGRTGGRARVDGYLLERH